MDWGILEDEGTLTSAPPSVQEPPSSHVEGSDSARSAEVGAEEVPEVLMEGGDSDAMPHELMEGGSSGATPSE